MGDDYTAGLARGAEIAQELGRMGERCGAKPCCVGCAEAIAAAIRAEADEEPTDPSIVVTCQACGQVTKRT